MIKKIFIVQFSFNLIKKGSRIREMYERIFLKEDDQYLEHIPCQLCNQPAMGTCLRIEKYSWGEPQIELQTVEPSLICWLLYFVHMSFRGLGDNHVQCLLSTTNGNEHYVMTQLRLFCPTCVTGGDGCNRNFRTFARGHHKQSFLHREYGGPEGVCRKWEVGDWSKNWREVRLVELDSQKWGRWDIFSRNRWETGGWSPNRWVIGGSDPCHTLYLIDRNMFFSLKK